MYKASTRLCTWESEKDFPILLQAGNTSWLRLITSASTNLSIRLSFTWNAISYPTIPRKWQLSAAAKIQISAVEWQSPTDYPQSALLSQELMVTLAGDVGPPHRAPAPRGGGLLAELLAQAQGKHFGLSRPCGQPWPGQRKSHKSSVFQKTLRYIHFYLLFPIPFWLLCLHSVYKHVIKWETCFLLKCWFSKAVLSNTWVHKSDSQVSQRPCRGGQVCAQGGVNSVPSSHMRIQLSFSAPHQNGKTCCNCSSSLALISSNPWPQVPLIARAGLPDRKKHSKLTNKSNYQKKGRELFIQTM